MSHPPSRFFGLIIGLAAFALFTAGFTLGALSAESGNLTLRPELTKFTEYDANSKTPIDHQALTDVLKESVFPMSPATKRLGYKNKQRQGIGTRRSVSVNSSPSRYEGNRLMIHAFTNAHENFFKSYQEGLESLTARRPLSSFNQDEQLAYWLNLYTIIVMNKVIADYPISNTKAFRKDSASFWQEKAATVDGTPLSLSDIEAIVISNWKNPLVVYGFWQGSVGGPTLPRQAYEGDTVWRLLERNAIEFINSNRGVIPKGDRLDVSIFYEWMKPAFHNDDQELLRHIRAYANADFMGDLSGYDSINYKYYDWQVADLVGGDLSTGNKTAANIRTDLNFTLAGQANTILDQFPPQAQNLLTEMIKEDIPITQGPPPIITTEECAPDEECIPNQGGT